MNTNCLGIEFFPGKERKNWKRNKLENWFLWKEWNIFPLILQFISFQKSNFLEYSSLGLFYVMALDQQREKVKHRIIFLFIPRTTIR